MGKAAFATFFKRLGWPGRLAIGALGAYLLYALAGWLAVPWAVRAKAVPLAAERLDRRVELEAVSFNPFTLRLTLEGLALADDAEGPFLEADRLSVNVQLASALPGRLSLGSFELDGGEAVLGVDEAGNLNVQRLIRSLAGDGGDEAAGASDEPVRFWLGSLSISNTLIHFSDKRLREPFRTALGPIELEANDLRSRSGAEPGEYAFEARLGEGAARISWQGSISLAALSSQGSFSLEQVSLGLGNAYLREAVEGATLEGAAAVSGRYGLSFSESGPKAWLKEGALTLADVVFRQPERFLDVGISRLGIEGAEAQYPEASLRLGRVEIDQPAGAFARLADGSLGLPRLRPAATPRGAAAESPPPPPSPPPAFRIDALEVSNGRFSARDFSAPDAPEAVVEALTLNASDIATGEGAEGVFKLSARVNPDAPFEASGRFNPGEGRMEADWRLSELDLTRLDGFAAPAWRGRIGGGALEQTGEIRLRLGTEPPAEIDAKATTRIRNLSLWNRGAAEPFFETAALEISEGRYDGESLGIGKVVLDKPVARIRKSEETINLFQAFPAKEETTPGEGSEIGSSGESGDEEAPPPVEAHIDAFELRGGRLRFEDASLDPPYRLALEEAEATIESIGLSGETARYSAAARVNPAARFTASGSVVLADPGQSAKANLELRGYDLAATSTYWERYLGRVLEGGTFSIESSLAVDQGSLAGDNRALVQRLDLGPKTASEEALNLPVGLAIALLQDAEGKIDLNVPVSGNLDDPSFSIAGLVGRVARNLIVKTVSSPFSLLANLAGTGEEQIRQVAFEPGRIDLGPEARRRLEALKAALDKRPKLELELLAVASRDAETRALRRELLYALLEALERVEEAPGEKADAALLATLVQGGPIALGATADPERRRALLAQAYLRRTQPDPEPPAPSISKRDARGPAPEPAPPQEPEQPPGEETEADRGSPSVRPYEGEMRRAGRFRRWRFSAQAPEEPPAGQAASQSPKPSYDEAKERPAEAKEKPAAQAAEAALEAETPSQEAMENALAEDFGLAVPDRWLAQLNRARARAARSHLVESLGLEPGRASLSQPDGRIDGEAESSSVQFGLDAEDL